jgi:hypothetical protein
VWRKREESAWDKVRQAGTESEQRKSEERFTSEQREKRRKGRE